MLFISSSRSRLSWAHQLTHIAVIWADTEVPYGVISNIACMCVHPEPALFRRTERSPEVADGLISPIRRCSGVLMYESLRSVYWYQITVPQQDHDHVSMLSTWWRCQAWDSRVLWLTPLLAGARAERGRESCSSLTETQMKVCFQRTKPEWEITAERREGWKTNVWAVFFSSAFHPVLE